MPTEQQTITQILEEIARMEEQIKTAFKRIDEQKKLTETVQDLAISVKLLAQSQNNTEKKVDMLSNDVEIIKSKPMKRWEIIVEKVILAVVGGIVGFILSKIGM